ncbi:MAG TPA: hypothetical protein VL860_08180 [Planctomycetota bacterium]|nr:hypothetical protein [Planctomycetota bacterium]
MLKRMKLPDMSAMAVLAVLALLAGPLQAEDLPPEVAAKVKELAPDTPIKRTSMRDRRGVQVYRVDLEMKNKLEGRIELQKDGTVADLKIELTEGELPEALKKSLAELYPGATFDNADRNLNDGKIVTDVEYTLKGQKLTATLDENGKVLDREDVLNAAALPAAAKAVLEKDFPGANVTQVRRLLQNGQDSFEARVERHYTVNLPDPAGTTTTVKTVTAAELPEATRAALQAAAGKDPAGLAIQMKVTSAVTMFEVEIYDRRILQFNLEGVLLSQTVDAGGRGGNGNNPGNNQRGGGWGGAQQGGGGAGPGNPNGRWQGGRGGPGGGPNNQNGQNPPNAQNENFAQGVDPKQDHKPGKDRKENKGEGKPEAKDAPVNPPPADGQEQF